MKMFLWLGWTMVMLMLTLTTSEAGYVRHEYPETVNSNSVTVKFTPIGEAPEWMAAIVQRSDSLDGSPGMPPAMPAHDRDPNSHAQWLPFQTNLLVDLGPGDGRREVMFGFKYKGQTRCDSWNGGGIVVQTAKPQLVITSPRQQVTPRAIAQLDGYFSGQAQSIKYDLYNQAGVKTINEGMGLVTNTYYDKNLSRYTTNYFHCFDVPLSPGTNTFVFHCEDFIGNHVSNNFIVVFSTLGDTNPPVITPKFPLAGSSIASDTFLATGMLDDPTAQLTGKLSANGQTNDISFRVGRGGDYYAVEAMPVRKGANLLALTATDAAGNITTTNLVFYDSDNIYVSMDPFDPFHPIGPWITVTGKVSPANCDVWVNGIQAKVKPDGTWRAEKLPDVRPNGGWIFDMTAILEQTTDKSSKLNQVLSAQASLNKATNAMVLNASVPACGVFQLHLLGTGGRSFVLEASTNLVEWTPLLTNSSSNPEFNYMNTNANHYPCRFFRVVPVP
jgi:hypothetical protein